MSQIRLAGSDTCTSLASAATGALAGLVVGATTVVVWGNVEAPSSRLYEIVPGFALSLLVTVVVSVLTYRPNPQIQEEFDEALRRLGSTERDEPMATAGTG